MNASPSPLLPSLEDASLFLTLLDEDRETWCFATHDDDKPRTDAVLSRDPLHGTLEERFEELADLNRCGAAVYVTVNPTDGRGRKIRNITGTVAVWADLDEGGQAALAKAPIPPHIVVETSQGHYQAFWLVEGLSPDEHAAVLSEICRQLGADPGAKGANRLVRLPGFFHQKVDPKKDRTGEPFLVRIVQAEPTFPYTREEILAAFPPRDPTQRSTAALAGDAARVDLPANPPAPLSEEIIQNLCEADPRFRITWEHQRSDMTDQSPSAYDMALVAQTASVLSDEQLWALIIAHRSRDDCTAATKNKAYRRGYIEATLAKARAANPNTGSEPGADNLNAAGAGSVVSAGGGITGAGGSGGSGGASLPPKTPKVLIILPSAYLPYDQAAKAIFQEFAKNGSLYARGNAVVELGSGRDGSRSLSVVKPAAFRSRLDTLGSVVVHKANETAITLKPTRCSEDAAKVLLETKEALTQLPPISVLAAAPVLIEDNGGVKVLGPGYHHDAKGVLVIGGQNPPTVPLADAVRELLALLDDFAFQTGGDRSRAVAAMITPGLKAGRILDCHTPIDIAEADQSQTGKTYRHKLVRAIYNEPAYQIALREGGVGSFDESLAQGLLSGRPFLNIDNVRGKIDSQYLEALLTSPQRVSVRVPYRGEVEVDASSVTIQLSSNGVEATRDLSNRAVLVGIRKQPKGYRFKRFPEGDVLQHVVANQPHYLGCVFAVIEEWVRAGKPSTGTTAHDFREWAGVLDWIVQHIFNLPPLLANHEEAQRRVSDPGLSWLRQLALAVIDQKQAGIALSASALHEMSEEAGLELPGVKGAQDAERGRQAVGKIMAKVFRGAGGDIVEVDGIEVRRTKRSVWDPKEHKYREVKEYTFGGPRPDRPDRPDPNRSLAGSESLRESDRNVIGLRAVRAEPAGQGDERAEDTEVIVL